MTKEQWELYKEFYEFAGLQDNSDAKIPNAQPSMKLYMEGGEVEGWDALDDMSIVSPEFLVYILLRAKKFWEMKNESNL